MESTVSGTPVRALCGKVWVPNRDPKKYPVCPECKEIYGRVAQGRRQQRNECCSWVIATDEATEMRAGAAGFTPEVRDHVGVLFRT